MTPLSKAGLILPCLLLLLTACAKPVVRTEIVKVPTPVYVPLPAEFFAPCMVPDPHKPGADIVFDPFVIPDDLKNEGLTEYAINLKTCLAASNDKLIRIRKLQP